MSKMLIYGWGEWYLLADLDEDSAGALVNEVIHTIEQLDEFNDKTNGYAQGFYPSATVSIDGRDIGTIESIIEQSSKHQRYEELKNEITDEPLWEVKNAWVRLDVLKGVFTEVEVGNYDLDDSTELEKLYNEILDNLDVPTGGIFNIDYWYDEDLECQGKHTKSTEYFIIHKGDWHEYEVIEEN